MTPYQKAITGIDEKARDKLIRGLTMTKTATPRTDEFYRSEYEHSKEVSVAFARKLESDRARLIEALGDAERRFKIASEEDISDSTFSEWAHEARSLLRELESK